MDVSPRMMASLVVMAINSLADGESECCPHECAGCEALLYLVLTDKLDEIAGLYVERAGEGWDWWDAEAKKVKIDWLMEHWCDPQTCDGVKFLAEESGASVPETLDHFVQKVVAGVPYE